jgi:hypothetical protein
MARVRVNFYAMPNEQQAWLNDTLAQTALWCVVRIPGAASRLIREPSEIARLPFVEPSCKYFDLFLGNRELVEAPVWRIAGDGREVIDLARSMAIQYVPSLVVDNDVLLEGQMAIMAATYYQELGLDQGPLERWFAHIAKSFQKQRSPAKLVYHRADGQVVTYPGTMLTPGAVQWRLAGKRLKQLQQGPLEFDVQLAKVCD